MEVDTWKFVTYIAKDSPPQLLAGLELLHREPVVGDTLFLAVDTLERIVEVGCRNGRLGDVALHLLLLGLEVEWFLLPFLVLALYIFRGPEKGRGKGRRLGVAEGIYGASGPTIGRFRGRFRGLARARRRLTLIVFFAAEWILRLTNSL